MKIYFSYAGEPTNNIIQAPYSITRNIYNFLKERVNVEYYHWDAINEIKLDEDDIVLGHPNYNENTTIQHVVRSQQKCQAKFLINPFHHNRVEDNFPFDPLIPLVDKFFAICGPYWIDTISSTPFAHWASKIKRLNMAVDVTHFPFLRNRFRSIGNRKLLYVGSGMPQKNLDLLYKIMVNMPDVELFWYGANNHPLGKLPNVIAVGWTTLNIDILKVMVTQADIFVNTSISDASPTALLEAAAIGFPVACTKESGIYNSPMVDGLSLDDVDFNISVLRKLLVCDEKELMSRAIIGREIIEKEHTWEVFCDSLWDGMMKI